ncbi:hypothetical protein [Prolixibacter sp. SD074]|uniref:hypothetical protein n=1 Tax=Prolixibacter sp. SD074 TaxID=2652391 RepID=UPI001298F30D|nr:hypothetical protein [Prolixibacter sp. SD074]
MGILTPSDLIKRPHKLVIDCLTEKGNLQANETITEALEKFEKYKCSILPAFKEDRFIGIQVKFKREEIPTTAYSDGNKIKHILYPLMYLTMKNDQNKLRWQIVLIIVMALFAIWNLYTIFMKPNVLRHYGWLGISIAIIAATFVIRKEIKQRMDQEK